MSRTINESIQTLETSRDNIVEALNAKLGGVDAQLKISEVAEKINSIEVGGGGSKLNGVTFNDFDGINTCEIKMVDSNTFKIKVTVKPQYESTQLFLCNSGSCNGALKSVGYNQFETENLDIDTYLDQTTIYSLIHASSSYNVLDDTRVAPSVLVSINQS